MGKNIICFLTVTPSPLFYHFAKKLENENTDVYICIDKNNYNIPNDDNKIKIIKMNKNICKAAGFKNTVLWCQKRACSRDKALYYFCTNNIPFKHLWFIEEDVFIPTIHTIENINKKYPTGDLLCKSNEIVHERRTDWNWPIVNKKIRNMAPPYSTSLVCAIRVSKKMLNVINFYVKKYKTLFLDEAFFLQWR